MTFHRTETPKWNRCTHAAALAVMLAAVLVAPRALEAAPFDIPSTVHGSTVDGDGDGTADAIQSTNTQVFVANAIATGFNGDWHGVAEFDISGLSNPVSLAELILTRDPFSEISAPLSTPRPFEVWGYTGNGIMELADHAAGALVGSFTHRLELAEVIDVTTFINSQIALNDPAGFAGFSIRLVTVTGNEFVTFGNGIGSDVYPKLSVVPEPSTLTLAGFGLIGLVAFGWRRRKMQVSGLPSSLSLQQRGGGASRKTSAFRFCAGGVLACLVSVTATPANATLIDAASQGSDLAGALVRVDFRDGTFRITPVVAGPSPTEGSVSDPGFFSFSVVGDTGTANWSLTNLYSADIDNILISLGTGLGFTSAVFDNNSNPSTPNSGSGVAGAVRVSGPVPFFSFEFLPWQDPMNQGDMFEQQQIAFMTPIITTPFPTGATFVWTDDTDIVVPEPSTFALTGIALVALIGYRWRRRPRAQRAY